MARIGLTAVLIVVELVLVASFFGLGFGSQALSAVAPANQQTANQYSPGGSCVPDPYTDYSGVDYGFCANVTMPNIAETGETPATSMLPSSMNGQSTDIGFAGSAAIVSGGNTGGLQPPTWVATSGSFGDTVAFLFAFAPLSTNQFAPFSAMVNGEPYSTSTNNPLGIPAIQYNVTGIYGNDGSYAPNPAIPQGTLNIEGQKPVGHLHVYLVLYGHECGSWNGNSNTDCGSLDGASQGSQYSFVVESTVLVQSGAASVELLTPGGLTWNGGPPIQVSVTTGYDGAAGYELLLLCPQPRSCGGQPMPSYSPIPVKNFVQGGEYQWSVLPGTGQNSTTPNWNQFEIELLANYVGQKWTPVGIDVNPAYAPTTPGITFTSGGPFIYPRVGDSLTLKVYANASAKSGPVQSVLLWVYYMGSGDSLASAPACGQQWVTSGCPSGEVLPGSDVQSNGNGIVATFGFTVSPPAGAATGIGVFAESVNGEGQLSNITKIQIQIASASCQPGDPGCPTHFGVTLWEVLGPLLLSGMIVVGSLLVAMLAPPVWFRYVIVVLAVGLVVALYFLGIYGVWFAPGGFLNVG